MDLELIPDLPNVTRVWRETAARKQAIQEELKTVRLTIKMQQEGIRELDERKRKLEDDLDAIWQQEDDAWDEDMGRSE
jgi:predicted  nucleic acid-binding Zn-ribbon protein